MTLRIWLTPILYVSAVLTIGGCASTHNLKTDGANIFGGGGFIGEELRPGLYRMSARSNMAIWPSFAAASETWKIRADQLCGKNAYENFETTQSDGRGVTVPILVPTRGIVVERGLAQTYNATMSGYVLCTSAHMTIPEAKDFLHAQQVIAQQEASEALRVELEQLGGDNCAQPESGVSGETYFRRGKVLTSLGRYSDAKACYFLAQQVEKDSYFYRESCQSLGLMYEIGLGVESDMQAAREWYRKAGL